MAILVGLFLSATLLGCGGGASIPSPPSNAPPGPPPGTTDEMAKSTTKATVKGMLPAAAPKK